MTTVPHRALAIPVTLRKKQLLLVAPFSPDHPAPHLGAAKKIELVVQILHQLGFQVHLLDSSHPVEELGAAVEKPSHVGSVPVTLYRPVSLPIRKFGKFLHVLVAKHFASRFQQLDLSLVWVYNCYGFEARVALAVKEFCNAKLVLELEDLPLARAHLLSVKPRVDNHYLKRLLAAADLVTCVNSFMRDKVVRGSTQTVLFPSLLRSSLASAQPMQRFTGRVVRVGYFGGLETEKGAGTLLQLAAELPDQFQLVITGSGALTPDFEIAAQAHPEQIFFHGRVSNDEVERLMFGCDIIVNPHATTVQFQEGVFPFKVFEAIASGALLVSTKLPPVDLNLSSSVIYFDGSAGGLLKALREAPDFYRSHHTDVLNARKAVCDEFGETAILEKVRRSFEKLNLV
jgi:glycosyltransferase involved in cell wall biosynthesis